ncbi:DoxX family membrane protein [Halorientalis sp.]|uniref:DoxX family membrane protein n=1 Tax=Halorientalis sp. TaxID=1931229 RepID=UPI0026041A66|nr:DoxX family membrane protein [Halorientalis sp.]
MSPAATDRLRTRLAALLPRASALARGGLGAMLVVAGVHKLVAPDAWAVYVVDWLAPWLVVSPRLFMLLNGPPEIVVGLGLLADRFVAVGAAIAAVSLTVTTAYLAVVALTRSGLFADVMIRDIALAGLAWAVLADAVRT